MRSCGTWTRRADALAGAERLIPRPVRPRSEQRESRLGPPKPKRWVAVAALLPLLAMGSAGLAGCGGTSAGHMPRPAGRSASDTFDEYIDRVKREQRAYLR